MEKKRIWGLSVFLPTNFGKKYFKNFSFYKFHIRTFIYDRPQTNIEGGFLG